MDVAALILAVLLGGMTAVHFLRHPNDPERHARFFRRTGFGVMAVFAALFVLFAGGETFDVPGGWEAAAMVTVWLLPLVGLSLLGWFLPDVAGWVLGALTGVVVAMSVWFAVDPEGWRAFEDGRGPVRAVAVGVLAIALAMWGLKRTPRAGVLLLVVGLVPVVLATLGRGAGGLSSLFVVSEPAVATGVLYLLSARFARRAHDVAMAMPTHAVPHAGSH